MVEAKLAGASQALRRLLGEGVAASSEVTEAASLVRRAAEGCDHLGPPLSAAWATVAWPRDGHLALWLGATILREHRAADTSPLAGAGLDGAEAVVSVVAFGAVTQAEATIIGWSESELKAATSRLIDRRWLNAEGRATEEGIAAVRGRIEDETNRLASPWRALGEAGCARLVALIEPLSAVIASQMPEGPLPAGIPCRRCDRRVRDG